MPTPRWGISFAPWLVRFHLPLLNDHESALSRDSPDDCRSAMNIRRCSALLQDGRELRTATDTSGIQYGGRVANLAIFAGIWTHFSRRSLVNA